jgi:hypothetical protein
LQRNESAVVISLGDTASSRAGAAQNSGDARLLS